ncbi:hypothetical protein [Entomomonas asaccharolytica]|uniref:Uncharacterized protein n=1 Tax=Entomomonas asaccharolytica TaxID=2785331 RepID=A0A974NDY7_9GAMM|nr:hypothetical protein [Entomomonas asaccharolytica]QQP84729.1 hypothetical protein JHT90_09950 [Entomomonas asaccharolytica]
MSYTAEEVQAIKAVITVIWSDTVAKKINVNDDVVYVVNKVLQAIENCSKQIEELFSTLNSTVGGLTAFSKHWLLKLASEISQAIDIAMNDPNSGKQNTACVNKAALNFKSELEMASQGIL